MGNAKRISGNTAVDYTYQARPKYRPAEVKPETEPVRRKKPSNGYIYSRMPKSCSDDALINRLCTFVLAFVIIATLGVCVVFLNNQYSYNELNSEIESIKRDLNTIKRENLQLEEDIKNCIDLEEIYMIATTDFNMRQPGPGDVYVIQNEPATYTAKYGSVEVKKEMNTLGNVLANLAGGW